MYNTRTFGSKLIAVAMVIAMALTMTVSAFAADGDIQPYYDTRAMITGRVNASAKTYTVTVQCPADTTKVKFTATLCQGNQEISTMTASANTFICSKSKSAAIKKGKTYVIKVTAQAYSGGSWDTINQSITVKT